VNSSRRAEIVTAARALVESEGSQALTMRGVATRLGIQAPSLYKHFSNKRALEAAVMAEGFKEFAERSEAAEQTLEGLAGAYREFALDHSNLHQLMTDRPLPRDLLPNGLEAHAAAPLVAVVGDQDRARAAWAFAQGMVNLEIAGRFPPEADIDAAWRAGIDAFSGRSGS
jgi:AcrR family transcriptional regulator